MRLCIIRHTIYDLKGYGLCRERHCLWAVPLLIFVLFTLVLSKLLSYKSKRDILFLLPM
nr:MAG TPA: hypothetical protein [Caudoviricetes sp.]